MLSTQKELLYVLSYNERVIPITLNKQRYLCSIGSAVGTALPDYVIVKNSNIDSNLRIYLIRNE